MRWRRPPRDVVYGALTTLVVMVMVLGGWRLAGAAAGTETTLTRTSIQTDVRTVKRVTKGRVITLPGGTKVVHVPLIIIHTNNKTIRVPAHNLPIRRVDRGGDLTSAVVAEPLVPVTVTIYLPSDPVTVTETSPPHTETVTVTDVVTVTLPLSEGTP